MYVIEFRDGGSVCWMGESYPAVNHRYAARFYTVAHAQGRLTGLRLSGAISAERHAQAVIVEVADLAKKKPLPDPPRADRKISRGGVKDGGDRD